MKQQGPNTEFDMDKMAQRLTVDVIGRFGFDRDFGATNITQPCEAVEVIRQLTGAMQSRNNPLNRRTVTCATGVVACRRGGWLFLGVCAWGGRMQELVESLVKDMQAHPPPAHTLGAHLMTCTNPDTGAPISNHQLGAEVGLFWGAGFETTAHSISWTLLLIATHPHVEQQLMQELAAHGLLVTADRPQAEELRWETLSKLKYVNAVIQESMRLYPVISPGAIRFSPQELQVGQYTIPANTPIWMPYYSIHRNPDLWQHPDSYMPERWLEAADVASGADRAADVVNGARSTSDASGPRHIPTDRPSDQDRSKNDFAVKQPAAPGKSRPGQGSSSQWDASTTLRDQYLLDDGADKPRFNAFLPFSEGARNCVGQALAMVELRAVIALLLGQFHFELTPDMGGLAGVDADAKQAVTLRPEHGLMMYAKHRSEL
eukprot:jgi/Chrzof1/9773/Cz04g15080.t1